MSKLVSAFVIFFISLLSPSVNSATYENVEGVLTEAYYYGFGLQQPPTQRTKPFSIKSDDSLAPYVRDEITLTILEIRSQKVPNLPKDSIKDLDKITTLKIIASGVQEIAPGAFNNVPKLTEVDLSGNELKIINNGVFSGLDFTVLTLENNKITTIEDKAFTNMKLESIYLQNNQISAWNGGWFTGSRVSSIFIGKNLLQELPVNSFDFIHKNKPGEYILEIADGFSNRTIVILYFENNQIKTIHPGAFNGLGAISTLNLENNQIEDLPSGAFDGITSVGTLTLSNNKLTKFNEQSLKTTNAISIGLEDNKLSEFPISLFKDKQVYYVLLRNNPLKCSYIEELENWKNSADYNRGEYEFPLGPEYENLKAHCV